MRKLYLLAGLLLCLAHMSNAQVDVTIQLDMSNQTDLGTNTPVWSGVINGWTNSSFVNKGNGIWEYTFTGVTEANRSGLIKYWNGTKSVFERNLVSDCGGFEAYLEGTQTRRKLPVPATPTTYLIPFNGCGFKTYEAGAWNATPGNGDHLIIKDNLTITEDMTISGAWLSANLTVAENATLTALGYLGGNVSNVTTFSQDVESATAASEITSLTNASISSIESNGTGTKSLQITQDGSGNSRADFNEFTISTPGSYTFSFYVKSAAASAWNTVWLRRKGWQQSKQAGVTHGVDWTLFSYTLDVTSTGLWVFDITVPAGAGDYFYDDFSVVQHVEGEGDVIVQSGGSLITFDENNSSNTVTIHRNTRYANGKYSFVGTPVQADSSIRGEHLGSTVYKYNETTLYGADGLARWEDATLDTLQPGMGYAQAFQQAISFTGVPNDGHIAVTGLSHTAPDANHDEHGWNLLSNPYPAAIDPLVFIDSNDVVTTGSIYLWDDPNSEAGRGANTDYFVVNNTGSVGAPPNGGQWNGYIGATQGFFVKVASPSADASVNFYETMRVSGYNADTSYFRKGASEAINLRLALNSKALNSYNETLIGLRDQATLDADHGFDADKFSANGLQLYSLIDQMKYAIQALPVASGVSTELGFDLPESGELTLQVTELTGLEEGHTFILTDKLTGKSYDLSETNSITFQATAGSDQNRFTLIYGLANVLNSKLMASEPLYRYLNGTLSVDFQEALEVSEYAAYDLSGQLITRAEGITGTTNHLDIPLSSKGITIVKIVTSKGQFTRKFIF